ncbi:hypothetical protein P4193_24905 [Pseudomonas aeruginosa]|nr:hypothetical protein [Pseudomonas aeruginosa]
MPRLDRKQSFGTLLETVTQQRLSQVASDALVELAKQLWYEERDLVPVLQREVASKLREPEQKLRALYLVDLLRRFPCINGQSRAPKRLCQQLVEPETSRTLTSCDPACLSLPTRQAGL